MHAANRGTLVNKTMIPDGSTRVTFIEGCLYVPSCGTNFLSFKKLLAKATRTGVLFRAGAQFLDASSNPIGYSPKLVHRSDVYPLVCTIIFGDVTKQNAIHDIASVVDFQEDNAHLQGVPADILQMCAQP